MTEPMRELGIMNLMVTARLPGTDGTSKGSSLMRRTISPKALSRGKVRKGGIEMRRSTVADKDKD
jgi:hypothetical protein